MDSIRSEAANLLANVKKLTQANHALTEERERLCDENQDLHHKIDNLLDENNKIKSDMHTMKSDLEREKERFKAEFGFVKSDLEDESTALKSQIEALKSELDRVYAEKVIIFHDINVYIGSRVIQRQIILVVLMIHHLLRLLRKHVFV